MIPTTVSVTGLPVRAGWTSSIGSPNSLMNTESISLGALSLSPVGETDTYEVGLFPFEANTISGWKYSNSTYSLKSQLGTSQPGDILNWSHESPIKLNGSYQMAVVSRTFT